jgi:hypothetical protein
MRRLRFLALSLLLLGSVVCVAKSHSSPSSKSSEPVKAYTTKKGRHVKAHERSAPNATQKDNYSTKGNVNPYTGKKGTKKPKH